MRSPSTSHRTPTSRRDARPSGFTLVEVIVALAIFTAILALGLIVSFDVYRGFTYRSERATIVALLTRARTHAMTNINQAPWGLCKDAGGGMYRLFRGAGYSPSASVDEAVPAGGATAVEGLPACTPGAGIVFAQLSGTTTGTTIQIQQSEGTSTITINDEGAVIW